MDAENIIKQVRAAMGTAVVWGAAWTALGLAAFAALKVAGVLPESVTWLDGPMIAPRFGIIGGVVGAAFSAFVGVMYRGRRLSDLRALRFGIGGGIVAGLFVPVFLQTMNLLSGDGLVPMELVLDDSLWASVFGAVAAGGSLLLAQRAQTLLPGGSPHQPGLLGSADRLAHADGWDARRSAAPRGAAPRTDGRQHHPSSSAIRSG
ncbi:MAG TPA: hypothetical protein VLK84_07985 [Longimicrobium sp.]|nr:hypothetical protein [Longimicrobium sp.]